MAKGKAIREAIKVLEETSGHIKDIKDEVARGCVHTIHHTLLKLLKEG